MKRIKCWYQKNELFAQILVLSTFSVLIVAFFCTYLTVKQAETIYINSHKKTTEILLQKMQDDYEKLNDSIVNRMIEISDNKYVSDYLNSSAKSPVKKSVQLFNIATSFKNQNTLYDDLMSNILILGVNGQIYSQNGSYPIYTLADFLQKDYLIKAIEAPNKVNYTASNDGYFVYTKNERVLIISKALLTESNAVYGYALMMIREADFSKFYATLLDANIDQLWIYQENNQLVSTNQLTSKNDNFDPKTITDKQARSATIHQSKLNSFGFHILLKTNDLLVAKEIIILPTIIIIIFTITCIILPVTFSIIKKRIAPVYELASHLELAVEGDFSKKITLHGTSDMKSLQTAYNTMIDDLNHYVNQLLLQEESKRRLEIEALQLQIQPHFIYNTLTAIKFQVMKQENDKAVAAIEAFTRLLRYTIGNSTELIPISDELMILKDYIQILQMRYGANIKVSIFNLLASNDPLVPKLLLQPIVENAFIHAFPDNQAGRIDILVDQDSQSLIIEILDNGIGITDEKRVTINHFSGIGLKNIQERLTLLYGERAKLIIKSVPNQGTSVRIFIEQSRL